MLCPDCGTEVQELVDGACGRCFTRRHAIAEVPKHIDVILCTICGARRDGHVWHDPQGRSRDEMIDEAVATQVRFHAAMTDTDLAMDVTEQDERNLRFDIMVEGTVAGIAQDAILETVARLKPSACQTCSRQAGGYYNAILQFRGTDRPVTKVETEEAEQGITREIARMVKQGNQNAFITKDVVVKGGKDYYISEIDVARIIAKKLAQRFDTDVQESPKLVGRKDGRDMYRVTFLVRLNPYRSGDFVAHRDVVHKVDRVEKKTIALRNLVTHKVATIPRDQVSRHDVVGTRADLKEMTVCSVAAREALVLDPDTNETHEVVLPESLEYDLSIRTMDILKHEGQAYFVSLPTERGRLRLL